MPVRSWIDVSSGFVFHLVFSLGHKVGNEWWAAFHREKRKEVVQLWNQGCKCIFGGFFYCKFSQCHNNLNWLCWFHSFKSCISIIYATHISLKKKIYYLAINSIMSTLNEFGWFLIFPLWDLRSGFSGEWFDHIVTCHFECWVAGISWIIE